MSIVDLTPTYFLADWSPIARLHVTFCRFATSRGRLVRLTDLDGTEKRCRKCLPAMSPEPATALGGRRGERLAHP